MELSCISMSIITIAFGYVLREAVFDSNPGTNLFKTNFTGINADYILPDITSLVPAVLLANTPQLVISVIYFLYSSLLTSMLTAREWSRFAPVRKPLRVSW